jgi:hypothetical protein
MFEEISRLPGFHVIQGKTVSENERARQKGVDVHLAVHMLSHATMGFVRNVTLLAGDADFEPLVDAVVTQGSYVTMLFDSTSVSQYLIKAADDHRRIHFTRLLETSKPEFKRRHPSPDRHSDFAIRLNSEPIKIGRVRGSERDARLFWENEEVVLVYENGTHWAHIHWTSEELVLAAAEESDVIIDWTS